MKIAGQISGQAHTEVMRFASADSGRWKSRRTGLDRPKREDDLSAVFEYNCAMEGAERPAYVPVVASG